MPRRNAGEVPRISIVIPSYNKGDYIERTLESVLNQGYPRLEVIIQDGGSTDGSVEVIRRLARKHPKVVKWVSRKDGGQVMAINAGLRKAKGEVLTYLNADDILSKGSLAEVAKYYQKSPTASWFVGQGDIVDEEGRVNSSWVTRYKNFLLRMNSFWCLLMVNYITQPSVYISKSAYKKNGPFTGTKKYVMEYDLWLKLGKVGMPVVIDRNLSSFRLFQGNLSSVYFNELLALDWKVAAKYTDNPLILGLHWLHNLIRICILKMLC